MLLIYYACVILEVARKAYILLHYISYVLTVLYQKQWPFILMLYILCIYYTGSGPEDFHILVLCLYKFSPFYVGSSDGFIAPGQLPNYLIYLYSNVCTVSSLNSSPKRGGVTLFFCIKAATLQYLGRVVWSVIQAIADKHLESHYQNSHFSKFFVILHTGKTASDSDWKTSSKPEQPMPV